MINLRPIHAIEGVDATPVGHKSSEEWAHAHSLLFSSPFASNTRLNRDFDCTPEVINSRDIQLNISSQSIPISDGTLLAFLPVETVTLQSLDMVGEGQKRWATVSFQVKTLSTDAAVSSSTTGSLNPPEISRTALAVDASYPLFLVRYEIPSGSNDLDLAKVEVYPLWREHLPVDNVVTGTTSDGGTYTEYRCADGTATRTIYQTITVIDEFFHFSFYHDVIVTQENLIDFQVMVQPGGSNTDAFFGMTGDTLSTEGRPSDKLPVCYLDGPLLIYKGNSNDGIPWAADGDATIDAYVPFVVKLMIRYQRTEIGLPGSNPTPGAGYLMSATEQMKLTGIQEGAQANVQPDWNATSGYAQILNKPSDDFFMETYSNVTNFTFDVTALRNFSFALYSQPAAPLILTVPETGLSQQFYWGKLFFKNTTENTLTVEITCSKAVTIVLIGGTTHPIAIPPLTEMVIEYSFHDNDDKLYLNRIEANVQPDYNQTDTAADDYIQNKPDLSSLHSHANAATLDNLTQGVIDSSHTHSNSAALDNLTQGVIDNNHTHANQTELDGISATDVANWDAAKAHADSAHAPSNAEANDPSTTLQGNTFNGASQLVQLDSGGKLPAVDGSQLTNLPAGEASPTKTSPFFDIVRLDRDFDYSFEVVNGRDIKLNIASQSIPISDGTLDAFLPVESRVLSLLTMAPEGETMWSKVSFSVRAQETDLAGGSWGAGNTTVPTVVPWTLTVNFSYDLFLIKWIVPAGSNDLDPEKITVYPLWRNNIDVSHQINVQPDYNQTDTNADDYIQNKPTNLTTQGNTFNGASQLVQLDSGGKLPAVDGSQLTNLPASFPDREMLFTSETTDSDEYEVIYIPGNIHAVDLRWEDHADQGNICIRTVNFYVNSVSLNCVRGTIQFLTNAAGTANTVFQFQATGGTVSAVVGNTSYTMAPADGPIFVDYLLDKSNNVVYLFKRQ